MNSHERRSKKRKIKKKNECIKSKEQFSSKSKLKYKRHISNGDILGWNVNKIKEDVRTKVPEPSDDNLFSLFTDGEKSTDDKKRRRKKNGTNQ